MHYEVDWECRAARVPYDDVIASDAPDALTQLIDAESRARTSRLNASFSYMAPEDAHIVAAVLMRGAQRTEVARWLGVHRTDITLRLTRAVKQLRLLLSLRTLTAAPARIGPELVPYLPAADVALAQSFWSLSFSRSATARALAIPSRSLPARLLQIAAALDPPLSSPDKAPSSPAKGRSSESRGKGRADPSPSFTSPLPLAVAHDLRLIVEAKAWWLGSHNAAYPRRAFLRTEATGGVG
jgi:hypothetical protein